MKLLHNFNFISGSKLNRLFFSFIASVGLLMLLTLLNSGHSYALNSHDQVFSDLSQSCTADTEANRQTRWLRSLPYQIDPSRPSQVRQGDTQVDIDVKAAAVLCNNGVTTPSSITGIQLELYNLVPTNAGGCSTDGVSVVGGSIIGPDFVTSFGYSPQDINGQITISIRNPKTTCVEVAFDASVCVVNTLPSQWAYYRCSNDPNVRGTSTHHTIRIPVAYPTGNVSIAGDCSAVSGNWPAYAGTGTTIFMRIEQNGTKVADNINAQIDANGNFSQQTYGQMDGKSGSFIAYAKVGNGDEISGSLQNLNCPGGGGIPGGSPINPAISANCSSGVVNVTGSGFTPNSQASYFGATGASFYIAINGSGGFSQQTESGLTPGNYSITVTDQTGQQVSQVITCSGPSGGIPASNYFNNCVNSTWLQVVVHAPPYSNPFGVENGQLSYVKITVDGTTVLEHNLGVVAGSSNVPGPAPVIPGPTPRATTPMSSDISSRIVDDNTMRNAYNGARWAYSSVQGSTGYIGQLAAEYFMNAQQASQAHTIVVTSKTLYRNVPAGGGTVTFSESAAKLDTFSASACQQAQQPQYYIDQADCSAIAGWAADPNDLSKSLIIHIRLVGNSNGRTVNAGPITANVYRSDVGAHSYSYTMDAGVKADSQSYSWTVMVYDTNGTTLLGQSSGTLGPCASVSIGYTCVASNGLPPRVYGVASAYPNSNPPLKVHVYGNGIDFNSPIATDPAGGWWFAIDGTYSGVDWRDWQTHTMDLIDVNANTVLRSIDFNCEGSYTLNVGASVSISEDASGNGYVYGGYTNTVSLANSNQSIPANYVTVTNVLYLLDSNGIRTDIQTFPSPSSPTLPRLSSSQTSQSYVANPVYINPMASVLGKQLCTTITINHQTYGGGPASATSCQTIAMKPYMQVYGADVWAGGQFGSFNTTTGKMDSCTSPYTNQGYIRLNTNNGSTGGGGTQLAAIATNLIQNMKSRVNTTGGHNSSLILANTPSLGSYTASPRCMFDYYRALDKTNSNASQKYVPGNLDLTSGATGNLNNYFSANQSRTLIVSGTVNIKTNIITSSSFSVGNAPIFVIVARNINIDPSVSRINAILIAQTDPSLSPTDTSTGNIQTCATSAANYFSSCGANAYKGSNGNNINDPSRLIIHGALIARKIYFQRTYGHLNNGWPDSDSRDASSGELNTIHSAELIDFSPELYLGKPVFIGLPSSTGQSTGTKYDSFEQLPPIF